jgi:hypothetical protein
VRPCAYGACEADLKYKLPEYLSWNSMRQRCCNPNALNYENYGGRGIEVCERWQLFENFVADMGKRPENHSLDRIDNDKGYEPGNCRWATRKEQSSNTRRCRFHEWNGEMCTMARLAEIAGLSRPTMFKRLMKLGWSLEAAMQPVLRK